MSRCRPGWSAVLLCGVLLCGGGSDHGGATVDAAPYDGGVATDASTASPLRVGSSYTLELATWNIRNFPTDSATVDRVAFLLAAMELDFVAVQEVGDVDAWQSMSDALNAQSPHPYETLLSPDEYFGGSYQKTGFLWRTDMIELVDATSLFAQDS